MEFVASLSQGRTAAAQCGLFTHKSVPVIFKPPCIYIYFEEGILSRSFGIWYSNVLEYLRMQLPVTDLVSANNNIFLMFKLTAELESTGE